MPYATTTFLTYAHFSTLKTNISIPIWLNTVPRKQQPLSCLAIPIRFRQISPNPSPDQTQFTTHSISWSAKPPTMATQPSSATLSLNTTSFLTLQHRAHPLQRHHQWRCPHLENHPRAGTAVEGPRILWAPWSRFGEGGGVWGAGQGRSPAVFVRRGR